MCRGCLSVDRVLSAVTDKKSLKIFCGFLEGTVDIDHPLLLCWECVAMMRKITQFIYQVRIAHDNIVKYMLHQSADLSPLTRLTLTNLDSAALEPNFRNALDKNSRDHEPNVRGPNGAQPLVFIKVEVQGEELETEFFGEEDACFDERSGSPDDKDSKADIGSDSVKEPSVKSEKSRTKKGRRKKPKEDFNESDDEPLKAMKRAKHSEVEGSKSKRRTTKKEDTESVRKGGRRIREKPSGVVHNPRVDRILQHFNLNGDQLEMVVLSWEEVEEERQRALASETFTRYEYRCRDCVVGFNHRFKLDNHMKKHDPDSGPEVCGLCHVRCRDAHALSAHRRRHRVRWRCVACAAAWSRAAVAADHIAREHGAPTPLHVCSVCGHRALTLGKLRHHIKSHAERQKCDQCDKSFRDRASLRTHLFIHKGEKEYGCPRCEKRFMFKKAMQIHLVTHEESAQVYCYECDMNFKNQMSYNQHRKYSLKHVDPAKLKYACHLCDKKFLKAKRLEEHNLAVHLKATPIQCTVPGCNFACASRPVLRTHTRVRHRLVRAKRDHVCDVCGKAYTSGAGLRGHLRAHSGERALRCARCPAAFVYEAALYNHNRLVHLKPKTGRGRTIPNDASVAAPLDTAGPLSTVNNALIWISNPLSAPPGEITTQQSADAPTISYTQLTRNYCDNYTPKALRSLKAKSTRSHVQYYVDSCRIRAVGGNGGDGCISFLSVWCKDQAGPDGGDGGHGGHVIFQAAHTVKSLNHCKAVVQAGHGGRGDNKDCCGKNARHNIIPVPLG
ncbi:unnamed protein product, partial [Iphiclides podalirius]